MPKPQKFEQRSRVGLPLESDGSIVRVTSRCETGTQAAEIQAVL